MKSTLFSLISFLLMTSAFSQIPKFVRHKSGLEIERRTQAGSFFDVAGRKSMLVGYENRAMEAWVYPMKIVDDFRLAFEIENSPVPFTGDETQVSINVRPEATTFTYSHAAFTVRQTIFAPIDEAGIVMLLDVKTVQPLKIIGSFRPKLSLMWPAGLMTNYIDYNKNDHTYYFGEETGKFIGMIGSPSLKDVSVMPYQEEPKDVPTKFVIEVPLEKSKSELIPIVITGSVNGRAEAKSTYQKLLNQTQRLYEETVSHYKKLNEETVRILTPDERLNQAYAWAKVGIDKGIATNPFLGTGLIAGFRTSGNSERPGFAWYFGRDSLWTTLAINAYGDFAATKAALEFLKKFQREDGKIPHEISQSASLINWFKNYDYAWHSADATPLYIVAHADYLRASGDRELIQAHWDSLLKAYRFSRATDTDGNGLIENSNVGHGWVEGGRLFPPHEEIYQQGVWLEALNSLAMMAEALNRDAALIAEIRNQANVTQVAIEKTFWVADQNYYGYATNRPRSEASDDEKNEKNQIAQARLKQLRESKFYDEVTVLPAVPMWWGLLEEKRANLMLDRIGSAEIDTDWGTRILSNRSDLYDPLSYHYGSVWPLFTGWASMAAYKYRRPQLGYDFLMANALLTYTNAAGYVTELLSGDFNQAFGRSSHHQIWSCAMVAAPVLRGMMGVEIDALKNQLSFSPQIPAEWDRVTIQGVNVGQSKWNLSIWKMSRDMKPLLQLPSEEFERLNIQINESPATKKSSATAQLLAPNKVEVLLALPFPPDAEIREVMVGNQKRKFEIERNQNQRILRVKVSAPENVDVIYKPGTEVYSQAPAFPIDDPAAIKATDAENNPGAMISAETIVHKEFLEVGAESQGLRLISAIPSEKAMKIVVEGLSERKYDLEIRSHKKITTATNADVIHKKDGATLVTRFPKSERGGYVRQEIVVGLEEAAKPKKKK